jgi:hypothetical protein
MGQRGEPEIEAKIEKGVGAAWVSFFFFLTHSVTLKQGLVSPRGFLRWTARPYRHTKQPPHFTPPGLCCMSEPPSKRAKLIDSPIMSQVSVFFLLICRILGLPYLLTNFLSFRTELLVIFNSIMRIPD